jgi:hypothetical protein
MWNPFRRKDKVEDPYSFYNQAVSKADIEEAAVSVDKLARVVGWSEPATIKWDTDMTSGGHPLWKALPGELGCAFHYQGDSYRARLTNVTGTLRDVWDATEKASKVITNNIDDYVDKLNVKPDVFVMIPYSEAVVSLRRIRSSLDTWSNEELAS